MTELSKLLISKRKELKLSLRKASDLIGISHTYLKVLEDGVDPRNKSAVKPTPETLKLISKSYNIDYNHLMSIVGYVTNEDNNKKIDTPLNINTNELFVDQLINGYKDKNINLDSLSKEEKVQLIKKIIAVTIALKDD